MTNLARPLTDAIARAKSFVRLVNGGYSLVLPIDDTSKKEYSEIYRERDFSEIDPRLAASLRYNTLMLDDDCVGNVGELLRTSQEHWNKPGPRVTSSYNDVTQQHEIYHLGKIKRVLLKREDDSFELEVTFYTTVSVDGLEIVNYTSRMDRSFEGLWLEHHYPGFAKRYEIGQGIGLGEDELAAYVVTCDAPVPDRHLPQDMSLD